MSRRERIPVNYPVIKGASYSLVHAPQLMVEYGTTPAQERRSQPHSAWLGKLPEHLRSFEAVVAYPPNQVYIGNLTPDQLRGIPRPWHQNPREGMGRHGRHGSIFSEEEFIGAIKLADSFDLVRLEAGFAASARRQLGELGLFDEQELSRVTGHQLSELEPLVAAHTAVPVRLAGRLVACVRQAHVSDPTLDAHVMLENLVAKASGILVMKTLFKTTSLNPLEVEYILEASEEACGDMNQRGGGNFAKAIGEMAGCHHATGADVRSFCAGPAHALVLAASLVQAGVFKNVVVMAGGTTAKLGLNARDHVNKSLPALEDMIGMFAIHIAANDQVNPVVRLDLVGRHTIGSGASPQAVMQALVADPLQRAGLGIADVDKYSAELQNPDITEPAGAGDVPKANFKMIGALAVKRGELERAQLDQFVEKHGMPGFAPTQGHVPSGVPFIGAGREAILGGVLRRVMIIGKGSLFLGRMTNQFDGVSVVLEANTRDASPPGVVPETGAVRRVVAEAMREVAARLLEREEEKG